jgi:hypothetical protein
MARYYDRQGKPSTSRAWTQSFNENRVAEDTLPNGRWVSTVWLGLDHSFGGPVPLIFETMVFSSLREMSELDCDRYATEAEALAGHKRLCEKWSVDQPVEEARTA